MEGVTLNMFGENGSHQGERGHFVDANRKHLTNLSTVALKDDDTIAPRSSRELQNVLARIVFGTQLAGTFNKNLDRLSEKRMVIFFADTILNRQQLVVATLFDVVGNVVDHSSFGFGSGPLTVFENEAIFESTFFDQFTGQLELFFGFPTKAHNEITGNRSTGNGLTDS